MEEGLLIKGEAPTIGGGEKGKDAGSRSKHIGRDEIGCGGGLGGIMRLQESSVSTDVREEGGGFGLEKSKNLERGAEGSSGSVRLLLDRLEVLAEAGDKGAVKTEKKKKNLKGAGEVRGMDRKLNKGGDGSSPVVGLGRGGGRFRGKEVRPKSSYGI